MNGNFLKRIFSCDQFSDDYKVFLRKFDVTADDFKSLVSEDNEKKVRYLASMV
jgi:hypothetical protein